ncbi:MAG: hypothetical protein PHT97_10945 [Methanoculleus sp.]|uniref:hypothetical protein n=1 Tax=Methanoculleus sp. TaxID=90427 RepID=UPI0026147C2B|nr:hypothetical protein [Methanoculleus sp.]MDD2255257.1 hypothetical protein [Methanoculleus sp.]MDD4471658.1 hypothetical protein [Methanoculleus sp.]
MIDIGELYDRIMVEREVKTAHKATVTSQWAKDNVEDAKNRVFDLDDEIQSVIVLNRECSVDHMCHVLTRNHLGDKRLPEEVWQFWKDRVSEFVEKDSENVRLDSETKLLVELVVDAYKDGEVNVR